MKTILVVGGAGFIGSHMVLALREANCQVIVLDNLCKGHRDAVLDARLIVGDMADRQLLQRIFSQYQIDAVMHFASFIEVGESVKFPLKYYENNVSATLTLLDIMLTHHVNYFIFSSTAAVYGEPQYTPIDETHPIHPINPYGRTKRIIEDVLADLAQESSLKYAALRYFNAAGADPFARLGERHEPESHLIPIVLQVAAKKRESITIYGQDYSTPDGTCIRDYIHVSDLCAAHLLALKMLLKGSDNIVCNLGTGQGYSVQEVLRTVESVTKQALKIVYGERRLGDPAVLVADATRAKKILHWQPKYADLHQIVQHAWNFLIKK
ncbi:MAG: hypothetical protein ACD_46C00581G0001 [uncultured bacterium]|nr:MAG: hypothetical protein ACD_46C00581G0001 [uncultured bacterium]